MSFADILVSNSIQCASPFECNGGGKVLGLCGRPFSFPQNHFQFAKGDVCFCVDLWAGAGFCQATSDSLRSWDHGECQSFEICRLQMSFHSA